jgi:hypothetical protein
MSEWPQFIRWHVPDDETPEGFDSAWKSIEVIPADLGRELYEAVLVAYPYLRSEYKNAAPAIRGEVHMDWGKLATARRRYEREVGE